MGVGGFKELLQGVSAAIQAAHAQANGRDVFADGHVAVGGAAMEEDGLISQIAADGIGGFHNGRMDILSTGRHIAITLVGHGDGVLAPTGGLFIAGLLQSVQDPLVQLLQHFLGVGAEIEFDGGFGDDGMDAGVVARMEV